MSDEKRKAFEHTAHRAIEQFASEHPLYRVDVEQSNYRGGTNYILYGHAAEQPVVFKYFVRPARWQNELYCLRHFQLTGFVPRIFEIVPEQMIVMARLPNEYLVIEDPSSPVVQKLSHEVGLALAALAQFPLPDTLDADSPVLNFSMIDWGNNLADVIQHYLDWGQRAIAETPACQDPYLAHALTLIESQRDHVAGQTHILFHEDISNFAQVEGTFQGFYDLEMCRLGCEAMQLGVALDLCGRGRLHWSSLRQGYEQGLGYTLRDDDLQAILPMQHFYHLIRICDDRDDIEWRLARMSDAAQINL